MSYCATMSYSFVLLCNHVLLLCLIAQQSLFTLSYCVFMSCYVVLLCNHVLLHYLIAQPCLIALSYCTTMSLLCLIAQQCLIVRPHLSALFFAQPCHYFTFITQPLRISLYLIAQPRLIS